MREGSILIFVRQPTVPGGRGSCNFSGDSIRLLGRLKTKRNFRPSVVEPLCNSSALIGVLTAVYVLLRYVLSVGHNLIIGLVIGLMHWVTTEIPSGTVVKPHRVAALDAALAPGGPTSTNPSSGWSAWAWFGEARLL